MKEKKIYLEFIRAFCMFLVIFNHTGTRGFFLFSISTDSIWYPLYLFLSVACKIAVPLYWMVSGALLLPKEESIRHIYQHRVLRMVLVLFFFSCVYYVATAVAYRNIGQISLQSFLIRLYTDQHVAAFWFIYAYIGMMLMLPFLRVLVKSMPRKLFYYLFFLVLFLHGILPMIEYLFSTLPAQLSSPSNTDFHIFSINSHVTSIVFSQSILYFIGGYYFGDLMEEREFTNSGALWWVSFGFLAIVLSCFMTHYKIAVTGLSDDAHAQTFYNNLICIPTFAFFYCTRLYFQTHRVSDFTRKIILSFGRCAFGTMLCEQALRRVLEIIYLRLVPIIHELPACIVWILAVYLCGYVITLCLKGIPGIRKIL